MKKEELRRILDQIRHGNAKVCTECKAIDKGKSLLFEPVEENPVVVLISQAPGHLRARSPKPEELARIIEVGDLREKVIISLFVLGGFREETLTKLRYRHVKEDLEKGIVPLHVHIESEITKGAYGDYDTFLGSEAVEYLRLYLDARHQGSPDDKIPPEEIHDDSPLIMDSRSRASRPIGPKQIRKLIHHLYLRAGLIQTKSGRMYDLRFHSLRKYFKTQMEAAGVNSDYIEYMMGHVVNTYHDVQALGIEFLRNIYASTGLSIKPRAQVSKIDMVKEFIRGLGMNPEEILTRQVLSEPHNIYATSQEREEDQIRALCLAFKEDLKKDLLRGENCKVH